MWSSSNMFLKKLITNNLCFPRSTSSSTPTPSCAALTAPSDHKSSTDNQNEQQIIKNFNTLYASSSKSTTPDDDVLSSFFTSSSNSDHHPDFATVFASQRFFFSSPGHSKSLIHQSTPPPPDHDNNDIDERNSSGPLLLSAGGVPVPKYSPDPYSDFRLSMQEMVEARVSQSKLDPTENWEYLHQLLTCYLSLNPKNTHECIIKAFSDLVVNFLYDKDNAATRQNDGRRRRSVSRRLL